MDPAAVKHQADQLDHEAALARQNPPPAEKAERLAKADQLDQEAAALREALAEDLRQRKALNVAARDATQVRVRFVRDLGAGASVGDYVVAPAHGPIRQRRTTSDPASSHPLGTVGVDVTVEDGEVRELPASVAEVLHTGGYVEVLGPVVAEPEATG
jgi:hypothetical protein